MEKANLISHWSNKRVLLWRFGLEEFDTDTMHNHTVLLGGISGFGKLGGVMVDWVLGTDTSHWSGNIDFAKMYNAGARFWITKASDANRYTGELFEDDRFDEYMQDAIAHGKLLRGCYHWLQASVDPTVAADFYLERYQRYEMDFPPVLDFEEPSVRDTGKFSDYAWRAQVWCKRCEEVTGRKPMIYTAKWFTSYFKTEYLSWMREYPLWVADYSWWSANVTKAPYYFPSNVWDDWAIWQFAAAKRGAEFGVQAEAIDLNHFQGDYADLMDWLQIDEPPTPLTLEQRVTRIEKHLGLEV
jgi:lysozyme